MAKRSRGIDKLQYGDFQTPIDLARRICAVLSESIDAPCTVLEPTCGQGSLLAAAAEAFPRAQRIIGLDRNASYLKQARRRLNAILANARTTNAEVTLCESDFFKTDWQKHRLFFQPPLLVIGNPPWVTNSSLATVESDNLPNKSNINGVRGIDAITGGGNFDISESMLLTMVRWFDGQRGALAMLCKSAVARKVMRNAWARQANVARADLFRIDAKAEFGASVDAALLLVQFSPEKTSCRCHVHPSLEESSGQSFGKVGDRLVADMGLYRKQQHLGNGSGARWRSGIKHDCARVMQLRREGQQFQNGLNELVELESRFLYPMLKASDLTKAQPIPRYWMLVPQQFVGQETDRLAKLAPKTWAYLNQHAEALRSRASVVYRGKPDYSVFGVGKYSFSRWKVAISGLAKVPNFHVVGPHQRKPTVFDDTCYFITCDHVRRATNLCRVLNSQPAVEFFESLMFTDEKRPITAKLLGLLNMDNLLNETSVVS